MKNQELTLKHLDRQLATLKMAGVQRMPKAGWVKTLRKALGLTLKQLAKRLGVDPSRVIKIESSEPQGRITLQTLQTVADAMDCDVVHLFVPRATLQETVKRRAKQVAIAQMRRTAHTMDLEAQSVSQQYLDEQIHHLTEELLRDSWKHLWEDDNV